jgi:hypothetical protein
MARVGESVAAQGSSALLSRPAETAGGAGALVTLGALAFGVTDVQVITALGTVAALLPSAVTFVVSNGGVRGIARRIWRGGN